MIRMHPTIIKMFSNYLHPVGEYYETSDLNFNPNLVWWGKWNLELDGTVLVSQSNIKASTFNATIGKVVGEEQHTLTIDEIPKHSHYISRCKPGSVSDFELVKKIRASESDSDWLSETYTGETGGGKAHNNIQPSKIINRWHRIS